MRGCQICVGLLHWFFRWILPGLFLSCLRVGNGLLSLSDQFQTLPRLAFALPNQGMARRRLFPSFPDSLARLADGFG